MGANGIDAALVRLLVDGVTDDSAAEAALEMIARAAGGIGYTSIIHRWGGPPPMVVSSHDESTLAAYAAHYWKTDVWAQAGRGERLRATSFGDELVAPEVFDRSEFFNDFLKPRGIRHILTAAAPLPGGFVSHSVLGGLHRSFTEADRNRLDSVRMLVSAMLAGRLAVQVLKAENALLAAGPPGPWRCVADADGTIMMALGDAPPEIAERAATATSIADLTARPLSGLLADIRAVATRQAPARSRTVKIAGTVFLSEVLPAPAASASVGELSVAIVVLRADEASRGLRKLHAWAAEHGLTPAETALATALGEGRSLADYAEGRGVAVATARSQLAAIYSKTGIRKQAALTARIATLLAA